MYIYIYMYIHIYICTWICTDYAVANRDNVANFVGGEIGFAFYLRGQCGRETNLSVLLYKSYVVDEITQRFEQMLWGNRGRLFCSEHLQSLFPKLALANGDLTALYKGPCLVCGNVSRAAHNICLQKCV